LKIWRTIHFTEALPGKPRWECLVSLEEAESADAFERRAQFEKEGITRGNGSKCPAPMRLPKINLVYMGVLGQEGIPVWVGESHVPLLSIH
jgi:hypothetical protein